MSYKNMQNQSKQDQSSLFQDAMSDDEYTSEEVISEIQEEEEDYMLDYDAEGSENGSIIDEEEDEDNEEEEIQPLKVNLRKKKKKGTSKDFDSSIHLKGINFKKGMDQDEFSILKKNMKRTKNQTQNKNMIKKLSTALKNVVEVDDFENFKVPQSKRTEFIQPKKDLLEQIQIKGDYLGKMNKFIRDISLEAQENLEFTTIMADLRIMIEGMQHVNFNWIMYQQKIYKINELFEFFISLVQENFHYNFIDLNPILQKLPISSMLQFFKHPLYDTSDWKLQETVNRFFVNILTLFNNYYLKFCLMQRQVINIKQIQVIDPFLRLSIRKNNLKYFQEFFWDIQNFELYDFTYEMIDKMILTILPRFKYEEKEPLILHILNLILNLYRFGLITFVQNKKMLYYIHLLSEALISYEQKMIDKQEQQKKENEERIKKNLKAKQITVSEKTKENFLKCKEYVCSILIHQAAIFCDITFEEAIKKEEHAQYDFRNLLMSDQTNFIYFSSISIKYLSQYLSIQGKEITSQWLQEGISILYNFIGDSQNDFFIQSLYLLKKGAFGHYYNSQYLKKYVDSNDAGEVIRFTNNFINRLKDTSRKNFQTELQLYFQGIVPYFERNQNNSDFNIILSKNNFPYFILMFMYYLDSVTKDSELFYHGFFVLQIILQKNYTGQGIIFRGDSITFFRQLMLNRNFECMVLIREVFQKDPFVLFISPSIFRFNINIYSQFLEKLRKQITKEIYSVSTRSLIAILFLFSFYFMNVLEDHEVKTQQRKKFHLIIAEELSKFFQDFVFPKFFNTNDTFVLDQTLDDILSFKLSDYNKFKKFVGSIDCKTFLEQFYYVIFKLFNKATYKEYSGNVCEKVFDDLSYSELDNQNQTTKFSLLTRLEKLKLRNSFQVFFNNNLLTQRELYNPKHTLICGEQCIPNRHYTEIFDIIFNEFKFFFIYRKKFPEINSADSSAVDSYLFKGLLNMIYRYLQGIRLNFYNFVDIPDVTQLKDFMNNITKQLQDLNEQDPEEKIMKDDFNRIYSNIYNTDNFLRDQHKVSKDDDYKLKLSMCYYFIYQLQKIKDILYENITIFNVQRREGSKIDQIDDQILLKTRKPKINIEKESINLIIFKDHIKSLIQEILIFLKHKYSCTDYQYIIDKYTVLSDKNNLINKKFLFSRTIIKNSVKQKLKANVTKQNSLYHQILIPFKTAYKDEKKKINEQGENNLFIMVLVNKKDLSKNLRNMMYYFIEKINELQILMNNNDYDTQFLNNDYYTYLIIIMDNLMIYKKKIKAFFLELIMQNDDIGQKARRVIRIISECQFVLYKIVLFKTFQDEVWKDYWSKFYIISKFMQNLCQNNDTGFKKILSSYDYAPGVLQIHGNRASAYVGNKNYYYFFELYILCEISSSENPAWFNRDNEIKLEDKPFTFKIMQRFIEQITEHVQGPYLGNQLLIYRYRPDIWQGLMTRVIDDIDDDFYQLSIAVVLYFDALIEGLDKVIVSFLSSNINIDQFFKVICRLIHKLYIRQMRYIEQIESQKDLKQKKVDDNISIVTIEDEEEIPIESFRKLLDMYQRYDNFTNHQVLKYAVQLYILLYNLSSKIKFFEFFLKDKQDKMQKYIKDKNFRNDQPRSSLNEFRILNFLKKIIINIEVITEQKGEYILQEIFFQRPAETFFMGNLTKYNFIDNMNIESVKEVHLDLFEHVTQIHNEMIQKKQDHFKLGAMYYFTTPEFFRRVHQFLYTLSFILNILMTNSIVFQHYDDEEANVSGARVNTNINEIVIKTIGLIIAIMSVFFSISWVIFRYQKVRSNVIIQKIQYGKKLNFIRKLKINIWNSLLQNGRFMSFFLHAVFSFLGVFVDYFYFTLNLLLISNLSKTISYVMKALVEHKQKFIIILILTFMVVFSYSFLMVRYFTEQVNVDQFGEDVCTDFFSCYFNSVNLGIRAGGGISDPLVLSANPNVPVFWGRFFFDLSFFFIVKMILLNVIAGIIIDAFNKLRDEMNNRSNFNNNRCFICGLSKWEIEKKGESHQNHINKNHSMWDYLYFMTKLESSEVSSLNGQEYQIYTQYQAKNTSWIPQNVFLDKDELFEKRAKPE